MEKITNYLNVAKVKAAYGTCIAACAYANFDPNLKVGDICVIANNNGFDVVKVVEIVDRNDLQTWGEVVSKVCTDEYDRRVNNRAKAAELKNKMLERAKQIQDIVLYEMLAKYDPEMMTLLQEYKSLSNS